MPCSHNGANVPPVMRRLESVGKERCNSHEQQLVLFTCVFFQIQDRIRKEVMGRLAIVSQERDNANDRIKELESKLQQLEQEHAQEILEVKRKAWCCYCFEPAVYHCCSGFAYCSRSCQVKDWDESHRSVCTRNLENGTA